jgi:hypothetical protein
MQTWMKKATFAAAALVLTTGAAMAQAMKAEIPFAFRAGDVAMQAGLYRVERTGSATPLLKLYSEEQRRSIILLPHNPADPAKAWVKKGDPVLAFHCANDRCTLAGVWTGEGPAYEFRVRPTSDDARITEVLLPLNKAD